MNWTNWYGNVSCAPGQILRPTTEDELAGELADLASSGGKARVIGAGHSNVPIAVTDDTLLSLEQMSGIRAVDREACTATFGPGTVIAEIGDALWQHGLALLNQGDIDSQQLAGALATGTHGTGGMLSNFGGALRRARLVTSSGETLAVGPEDDSLLDAVRTSVGLLGVLTELTLQVREAYCLERRWLTMRWEEFEERWRELLAANRHFTFFWNPYDDSASMFGLPPSPGGQVLVKLMNELPADAERRGSGIHADPDPHVERSYRVFPDLYEPHFAELEYLVDVDDTIAAVADIRSLLIDGHPDQHWPVECRFTAGDPGWLSPAYERRSCVISCCGDYREEFMPFIRDCAGVLANYAARPHWGKLHFPDPGLWDRLYPRLGEFRALRDRLDPARVLVNAWLEPLAG